MLGDVPCYGSTLSWRSVCCKWWFCFLSVSVLCLTGMVENVAAQGAPDNGLRREEERERLRQQQVRPQADVLSRSDDAAEDSADAVKGIPYEDPCFPIHTMFFVGPDARHFRWFEFWMQETFKGRCLGPQGLKVVLDKINNALIKKGYVTSRVSLPEQSLKRGRLAIRIEAGRVGEIRMVQADKAGGKESPDEDWGTWQTAFPVSSGDILNIRDVEQGLEQMRRLPSQTVTTRLEPGREPLTSDLIIERRQADVLGRLRGGISIDNSGTEILGRTQGSAYLVADNLLGLNDSLSLTGGSNLERVRPTHRSQSVSANYSVPIGYTTLSGGYSYSRFAQMVQGAATRFLSSGLSETISGRVHHTALRTSTSKTGVYAGLGLRRARGWLDDVEILVQRRRTAHLDLGVDHRQFLGSGTLDIDLHYRHGTAWFNASRDYETAKSNGLTMRPNLWFLTARYDQPFSLGGTNIQYSGSFTGQYTENETLSVDQMAIGSRWTVRGFDGDSVLMAESGFYSRNEIAMPFAVTDEITVQPYFAFDYGQVWGPSAAILPGHVLAGAAWGVRGQWKTVQLDLAVGTPVMKPQGFHTQTFNPYLSLTVGF